MRAPAPEDDADFLAQYVAQSRRIMRDLQAAREAIRQVEARAESDDGLVAAACDGQGGLSRLRIDPRALRLGEAALGRKVTEVLRAAQEEAGQQAQEIADRAGSGASLSAPLDETFVRARVEQAARDLL
ncbi:YbaB/EbfC family nucleoid-associated protein [Nonomuraea sp. MG754425]|uniref:YbaB/EbfC family nucleoid-associated protein n=1 Tax=Nonomuraea sp. MG754425 TaxID=2570319 RepID=UPI001F36E901|nr:YbaB/EbfC family nucleoid-associated protein [Nonomuraea sp. MG754425]MCF6471088.1 YbaB/EbfC family nucleoid-associated protein [Nonomuraea sp. MG754425]